LLEVLDPESEQPAAPGEIGVLVVTPFAPFRETVPLLRFATGDLVRTLTASPDCALRQQPATSDLLGKRSLSIRLDDGGWVTPRQVLEALEGLPEVPLPARCGFWAVPGGVAVEAVARACTAGTRAAIAAALETQGVPLQDLRVVTDRSDLARPLPLRGDLREQGFAPGLAQPDSVAIRSGQRS
jgi:hypothetical protein